jgi:hypothetical protein
LDKRYQVFVSSTYQDLIQERVEVIQALLELDCIPCGMEYFPAADETQWDFIKKLIDESDYYIVVIGGKYGSVDENGISYTQKEYEYALSKGIPTIGFLHKDPDSLAASKTEKESDKQIKLEHFKELVKKKLCKFWTSPQELGAVVSRSVSQAKKNYPRVGWVRADSISEASEKEILQLYKKIQTLESKLIETSKLIEVPIENLADGEEKVRARVEISSGPYNKPKIETRELTVTWNDIAYHLLPKVIDPIKESSLKSNLNNVLRSLYLKIFKTAEGNLKVIAATETFETIKIQFQLLKLLNFYNDTIIKDDESTETKMVSLTQQGRQKLISLRAIMKKA